MAANERYDVVVAGAGNAALCAAMAAADEGASVLVLERAPEYLRGGNSFFTGGLFRFAYDGIEDILGIIPGIGEEERESIDVGKYTQSQFYDDLMRVTEGLSDPELAQVLVSQSYPAMKWMEEQGVRWILAYGRQAFRHEGMLRFWGGLIVEAVGAGKGLTDLGVRDTGAQRRAGAVRHEGAQSRHKQPRAHHRLNGAGCGGLPRGRHEYGGAGVRRVRVEYGDADALPRAGLGASEGARYAVQHGGRHTDGAGYRGAVIRALERLSCGCVGHERATIRGPQHRGPVPEALVPVRADRECGGEAFVDEGADLRNYTYAKYGKEILAQPQRVAFQLFDQKTKHLLRDEYFIRRRRWWEANTIEALADGLASMWRR